VWAGPKDGVIVKSGGALWLVAVENGWARRCDVGLHYGVYLVPKMGPRLGTPIYFSKAGIRMKFNNVLHNFQWCTKWPHCRTHF
jgi:hypothetical protein